MCIFLCPVARAINEYTLLHLIYYLSSSTLPTEKSFNVYKKFMLIKLHETGEADWYYSKDVKIYVIEEQMKQMFTSSVHSVNDNESI